MNENQYIAVVDDGDNRTQMIECSRIEMNNVGGTQILGYIKSGIIGWETTLAVIPATYIVRLVDMPKRLPEPEAEPTLKQ